MRTGPSANERGAGLILAALALVLVSGLGAGVMAWASAARRGTNAPQAQAQARFLARSAYFLAVASEEGKTSVSAEPLGPGKGKALVTTRSDRGYRLITAGAEVLRAFGSSKAECRALVGYPAPAVLNHTVFVRAPEALTLGSGCRIEGGLASAGPILGSEGRPLEKGDRRAPQASAGVRVELATQLESVRQLGTEAVARLNAALSSEPREYGRIWSVGETPPFEGHRQFTLLGNASLEGGSSAERPWTIRGRARPGMPRRTLVVTGDLALRGPVVVAGYELLLRGRLLLTDGARIADCIVFAEGGVIASSASEIRRSLVQSRSELRLQGGSSATENSLLLVSPHSGASKLVIEGRSRVEGTLVGVAGSNPPEPVGTPPPQLAASPPPVASITLVVGQDCSVAGAIYLEGTASLSGRLDGYAVVDRVEGETIIALDADRDRLPAGYAFPELLTQAGHATLIEWSER